MGNKNFKDPIYGYIQVDEKIVHNIIDNACFQRLRNIRQTSYEPLYSAALHNRFIHSIGVYHLGIIAAKSICSSLEFFNLPKDINNSLLKELSDTFCLACLLHDVGHAPFSHSGEKFYSLLTDPTIIEELEDEVRDDQFVQDSKKYTKDNKPANPHETMSALVGLRVFSNSIPKDTRDFFARCITGYQYVDDSVEKKIKNCFITMLNSDIIDVDKLDYLMRDAFVTGYDNVRIDYNRLLQNVEINKVTFKLQFRKNALSVIESVVIARDAEKKWIQSHPTILYETFLIQHMIKSICDKDKDFFCYEALTVEGFERKDHSRISLLSDDDILVESKKEIPNDNLIKEFFSRDMRRHPIWKSEAEYQSLFRQTIGEELLDVLEREMDSLASFLMKNFCRPVIDDKALEQISQKIYEIESSQVISKEDKEITKQAINDNKKWIDLLKRYADENDVAFDFVIITASLFKSGFDQDALAEMLISFPEFNKENMLRDIVPLFNFPKSRQHFFYIYHSRKMKTLSDTTIKIDARKFSKFIRDHIEEI